uniref:Uncharacterized protein n=1 Tax=Parastrongyloides trichosuri TaxID=131310 RepID=A0A0N4ZDZ4_PARTI
MVKPIVKFIFTSYIAIFFIKQTISFPSSERSIILPSDSSLRDINLDNIPSNEDHVTKKRSVRGTGNRRPLTRRQRRLNNKRRHNGLRSRTSFQLARTIEAAQRLFVDLYNQNRG